ncbi:monovalent cation/H(+) antiporter subunit G [Pelobacter seleniigenes]|uniref:monovalent cation/H(+) antiporter subunit G n=1 Tax=Pelobacter seleniigenes TaxID=407188 RepID=UPI0004A761EF|nr:monovalent cation/H(+) antiporter subunit G [Pelobacter seleniigenes]
MSALIIFFLLTGLFFFTIGVIGVLRFPDFYSRLHAAGKSDSLAAVLIVIGVALYQLQDFTLGNILVAIKIMLIAVFIYVASPTATHAITKTALVIGVVPWAKKKR